MIQFDRNILFLFAGRIMQALLAIVSIRVMTELMTSVEIGNQYVINSIVIWFSLVLINPMGMYINRHINEWKSKDQIYFYLKKINLYFLLIAVFSFPVVFLAKNFFSIAQLVRQYDLLIFVIIYLYISTWFQTLVSFFNLLGFQKIFASLNILSQFVGLLASFITITYIRSDAIGWMSGLLFGQGLTLVTAVFLFRSYIPRDLPSSLSKGDSLFNRSTFLFCYPVAIATVFMWFLNQGYRLFIEKNLGADILGSIGIGLGLAASLASVVESITTQYLYPKYYASLSDSNFDERKLAWALLWKKSVGIYILTAVTMLACSRFIVDILVAQKFQHVVYYLMVGVLIEFLKQSSNIIYIAAHGEKRTEKNIMPYLLGAIFLLVTFQVLILQNNFLIDRLLLALVLSHFVTYIYNVIQVKKMLSLTFDKRIPLQSLILSVPLIGVYFLMPADRNLYLSFGLAAFSILWCLGSIYILNQKIKAT